MGRRFTAAEERERRVLTALFKHIGCENYSFTPIGSKKTYDFKFNMKNQFFLGELKVLTTPSTKYNNMLLEYKKAQSLVFEAYKQGIPNILYVMYYSDGKCRVLRVTPAILDTDISWITNSKISKPVYLIDSANAKTLTFDAKI